MQVFNVSSRLLFSCLSIYFTISTVCTLVFTVKITRPVHDRYVFMSTFTPIYFFMDQYLVYLFDSKNVPFCNSIWRYLMFLHVSFFMSVYFFHGLASCLPFFYGQDISFCCTTSRKLMFLCLFLRPSFFYRPVPCSTFLTVKCFVL